jgi:iron complex outermembrane recepter protein
MCLVVSLSAASQAPLAVAQQIATEDQGGVLEEVLVTAQRRTTDIQRTAAAISAYSADDLAARSVVGVGDLANANSSMLVSMFQGEAQIYIRGIVRDRRLG